MQGRTYEGKAHISGLFFWELRNLIQLFDKLAISSSPWGLHFYFLFLAIWSTISLPDCSSAPKIRLTHFKLNRFNLISWHDNADPNKCDSQLRREADLG
jgi:hypothetical protein